MFLVIHLFVHLFGNDDDNGNVAMILSGLLEEVMDNEDKYNKGG